MTTATTEALAATTTADPEPALFSPPTVLEEEEEEEVEEECVSALQLVEGQKSDYRCILARATSLIDGKTDVIIDVSDYGCEEEEVF